MTREEAINIVRNIYQTDKEKEALGILIPELSESEDERIMKALIEVFKKKLERGFEWVEYGIPNRSVLDWLEKQKEQEPLHWRRIEDATTQRTDDGCCVTSEKMLVKGLIDDEDYRIIEKNTMVNKNLLCVPVSELNACKKQKEQKPVKCELEDAFKYYTDAGITVSCGDIVAKPKGQSEEPKIVFGDWGDKEKREAIITCLKYMKFIKKITNQEYDDLIKWLDNNHVKVEQKPAEKHDLLAQLREHLANTPKEQLEAEWKELEKWNHVGPTVKEYLGGIKPVEWSEEDSDNLERIDNYLWMLDDYVGDDCAMPQGKTDKIRENIQEILLPWIKSLPERFNLQPKEEWSDEDEANRTFILESLEDQIRFCKKDAKGAYYTKQIQTAQNWLKSLSLNLKKKNEDVAKLCSNEWSEEDEKDMAHIIRILDDCYVYGTHDLSKTDRENLVNKLKSLRPSWKPSEEQMNALNEIANILAASPFFHQNDYLFNILNGLREELKKLL